MTEVTATEPVEAGQLRQFLGEWVLAQPHAIEAIIRQYMRYRTGLDERPRPVATILLAGPTGTGKTELAQATAHYMCGSPQACIRIDCGEYQYGHEIAKLVGSPPGYLGHRETKPVLTSEALAEHEVLRGVSIVNFDEVEKAHSSLHNLLLAVLDKARLTIGTNDPVDFSRSFVFMTTNLGFEQQSHKRPGFATKDEAFRRIESHEVTKAIRRRFAPEFLNRIDEVVVMNYITPLNAKRIAHNQIESLAGRVFDKHKIILQWSNALEDLLVERGYSEQYGARDISRAIQNLVVARLGPILLEPKALAAAPNSNIVLSITAREGKVVIFQ